ncbi:MAG: hypothetical protein C4547_08120 [Phycisphaerales bacterium]|nr:MAG: hypothetical protein C4547_08120 [Phycisphaerales bacterium]
MVHPSHVAKLRDRIELTCEPCGRSDRYDVGTVLISPCFADATDDDISPYLSFTHYFLCRHCDGGGPWRVSAQTQAALLVHLDWSAATNVPCGVVVGESATIDGKRIPYPTQIAAYLKSLLDQNPTDPDLWLRLGNVYHNGDRSDLALRPLRRAVELNPNCMRPHNVLARCHEAMNRPEAAIREWLAMLACAPLDRTLEPQKRVNAVSLALSALAEADRLDDAMDILSRRGRRAIAARPYGLRSHIVLRMTDLDLSDEDDWLTLCAMFAGFQDAPPQTASHAARPAALERDPYPSTPRNAKCPCGSGRKYKKCCGAPADGRGKDRHACAHAPSGSRR